MTATTEPKFCKDCAHYGPSTYKDAPGYCNNPQNMVASLETGGLVHQWWANTQRESRVAGNCGKDAHWFKAKVDDMWPFPEKEPEPPKTPRWKVWLARVMGL